MREQPAPLQEAMALALPAVLASDPALEASAPAAEQVGERKPEVSARAVVQAGEPVPEVKAAARRGRPETRVCKTQAMPALVRVALRRTAARSVVEA